MRCFRFVVAGAGLLVSLLVVACGGSVILTDENSASIATCGANCSPSAVATTCAATCAKLERLSCPNAVPATDCASSCMSVTTLSSTCASLAYAYLRCADAVDPTCDGSGNVTFPGCDAAQKAVSDCVSQSPVVVGTTPGGTVPAMPGDVCPNIPRPAGGAGSCAGGGGGGPGAPATYETTCQDAQGDTWQASCTGSSCTCTFNSVTTCVCSMTVSSGGAIASCCPGT
jgi:hypothetical protein